MGSRKTVSVINDNQFIDDLSGYLDVLSNPVRLRILKFIEQEPKEVTAIAEHIGSSYQNTRKHLDLLVSTSLVKRAAGFGRETGRGVAPVWKYSLAEGAMEKLVRDLGVFSSITVPVGYQEINERIKAVRSMLPDGLRTPVLYLVGETNETQAYLLSGDLIAIGREDPGQPPPAGYTPLIIPDRFGAVTRISHPHAAIRKDGSVWEIEDCGSTSGTYLNSRRLQPGNRAVLSTGDVIELSAGTHGTQLLFISGE